MSIEDDEIVRWADAGRIVSDKLKAAEQEIAALEALLREAANVLDGFNHRYDGPAPHYNEAEELIGRIAEALNKKRDTDNG